MQNPALPATPTRVAASVTGDASSDVAFVVVHADESCLGNQNDGLNPGGAGALIEVRAKGKLTRRELSLASTETTNNRMALAGAIEVLERLSRKGHLHRTVYFSDSQYLVKGITEWVRGWKARGWRRKAGPVENVELWKTLDALVGTRDIRFEWVRGHAGHVKNEYADHLAVSAAREQQQSGGIRASGLDDWLAARKSKGQFVDFDPDADFERVEREHGAR